MKKIFFLPVALLVLNMYPAENVQVCVKPSHEKQKKSKWACHYFCHNKAKTAYYSYDFGTKECKCCAHGYLKD